MKDGASQTGKAEGKAVFYLKLFGCLGNECFMYYCSMLCLANDLEARGKYFHIE